MVMLLAEHLIAQKQDWTAYESRIRNYPSSTFFTGYMSAYLDKGDDLESLKLNVIQQARIQLSENIRISIESEVVNKMTNINSVSLEEFEKVSRSYSQLNLSGLKTDFYIDKRKKEIRAFAWIRKSQVVDHYSSLLQSQLIKIKEIVALSNEFAGKDQARAVKVISSFYKTFREIEEAQIILMMCGLDDPDELRTGEVFALKKEIEKIRTAARDVKKLSVAELSRYLVATIKVQQEELKGPIYLSNITYRNSNMGSEFSERFSSHLLKDLTNEGFEVYVGGQSSDESENGYSISGHYWEYQETELQVLLTLRKNNPESQMVVGGVEGQVSIENLTRSGLEYKPSNYFEATEKNKLFSKNEIVNGGAQLEVWTNKGDNGLIFREGDKLRLLIRLNQTGYVRLINHWADGTQVLLVDNYFVDYRRVNRIIELPLEWEVACPCGAEFVQVNAQNTEFIPLETVSRDGFEFIVDDTNEVIAKSRSFRDEAAKSGGFAVEERIVLATLE